jgi:TolB-like protein
MPRLPARTLFVALAATAAFAVEAASAHAQDEPERSVVAVLRYDNNTGDQEYDHLGRALSSMLISDLSAIDRIQLVERERLDELVAELDFQQSGYVDPESAQTVGMIIGAQFVVAGAFVTVDPEMRLDTRIAKVETSEIVTTAEVTGQQESLFDLQQRLAAELIDGFELVLTEEEQSRLHEQQEANRIDDLETMVRFSQALCYMDYGAYVEAGEALRDVQERAPGSALVRATMSIIRDHAEDEAESRVRAEANRRIGGLLGRRGNAVPERRSPPAQCG